jgi:hypothetical protein
MKNIDLFWGREKKPFGSVEISNRQFDHLIRTAKEERTTPSKLIERLILADIADGGPVVEKVLQEFREKRRAGLLVAAAA